MFRKAVSFLVLSAFLSTLILPPGYAQSIMTPMPVSIAGQAGYAPVLLKGMTVDTSDPFHFDFIVDNGHSGLKDEALKIEGKKLVNYFLGAMTVPQNDLWVNLSPKDKDKIVPNALGKTELGIDLLAQDYMLKQITAALMHPEGETGKRLWDKIYEQAREKFGTADVPGDIFSRVWIMPESATIYEKDATVYIVDTHLKVLLEEEYFQQTKDQSLPDRQADLIKSIILPELEKQVNHGKDFAPLRQIYYSLILAKWYKDKVRQSILSANYIDQNKTEGLDRAATLPEDIYSQYMNAFKSGAYTYIKEDYDPQKQSMTARKYFSGGIIDKALTVKETHSARAVAASQTGDQALMSINLDIFNKNKNNTPLITFDKNGFAQIGTKFLNIFEIYEFLNVLKNSSLSIKNASYTFLNREKHHNVLILENLPYARKSDSFKKFSDMMTWGLWNIRFIKSILPDVPDNSLDQPIYFYNELLNTPAALKRLKKKILGWTNVRIAFLENYAQEHNIKLSAPAIVTALKDDAMTATVPEYTEQSFTIQNAPKDRAMVVNVENGEEVRFFSHQPGKNGTAFPLPYTITKQLDMDRNEIHLQLFNFNRLSTAGIIPHKTYAKHETLLKNIEKYMTHPKKSIKNKLIAQQHFREVFKNLINETKGLLPEPLSFPENKYGDAESAVVFDEIFFIQDNWIDDDLQSKYRKFLKKHPSSKYGNGKAIDGEALNIPSLKQSNASFKRPVVDGVLQQDYINFINVKQNNDHAMLTLKEAVTDLMGIINLFPEELNPRRYNAKSKKILKKRLKKIHDTKELEKWMLGAFEDIIISYRTKLQKKGIPQGGIPANIINNLKELSETMGLSDLYMNEKNVKSAADNPFSPLNYLSLIEQLSSTNLLTYTRAAEALIKSQLPEKYFNYSNENFISTLDVAAVIKANGDFTATVDETGKTPKLIITPDKKTDRAMTAEIINFSDGSGDLNDALAGYKIEHKIIFAKNKGVKNIVRVFIKKDGEQIVGGFLSPDKFKALTGYLKRLEGLIQNTKNPVKKEEHLKNFKMGLKILATALGGSLRAKTLLFEKQLFLNEKLKMSITLVNAEMSKQELIELFSLKAADVSLKNKGVEIAELDVPGKIFQMYITGFSKEQIKTSLEKFLKPKSSKKPLAIVSAVPAKQDHALITDIHFKPKAPGGIDMNNIQLLRQEGSKPIFFDADVFEALKDIPLNGLTPVIVDITPISSVLPLLGLKIPEKRTETARTLDPMDIS